MEDHRSSKKVICLSFGAALFLLLATRAAPAEAASLYLAPSSGEHAVGQSFSLTVGVSSPDQAANAVSGTVSFPVDKLEVTAVSKSGSVLGLWVQEPSFSNASGTVNFEGIVLNPGFTGSGGKIISVSFKAKAVGAAAVSLSSGTVLANDGLGTNITTGLGRSTITIKGKEAVEPPAAPPPAAPPPAPPAPGVPPALIITSPSHPDSNAWYDKNIVELRWSLGRDVTAVSVFLDQKSDTAPAPASDGLFADYTSKPLADGIWYFHLRAKNAAGWGPASHFRIQIDTVSPENFQIKLVSGEQSADPQPVVEFNAADLSGVDHFEIKVGDGKEMTVKAADLVGGSYTLPVQQPGTWRLFVEAVDRAGNRASTSVNFKILALKTPTIDRYPARLRTGDALALKGTTDYPDMLVMVWIQPDGGQAAAATVKTDAAGRFVFLADDAMREGIYKLWAQVSDGKGGISAPSDKITVVVTKPAWLVIAGHEISLWWIILLALILVSTREALIWRRKKRAVEGKAKKRRWLKKW